MRWLLIGGGGFIGSHLTSFLLKNKQEVIVYDNNSFCLPGDLIATNFHRYLGDVSNTTTLATVVNVHNPEVVCWLVAFHAYDAGENPFIKVSWLNYTLNNVLPVVATAPRKFVLFSSEAVYVPQQELIVEESPLRWGHPRTEIQGHIITEWYTRSLCGHLKIPYMILRLSNTIGKRQFYHPVVDRLSFMIDHILLKSPTLIITNPNQARDYLYINDAIPMIYKIIRNGQGGQVYNIASGIGVTNDELLQELIELTDPSHLPKVVDSKEANIVLSTAKSAPIAKGKITPINRILPGLVNYRKEILGGF